MFHAIAPLKRMEFLIKFVSGLGRMMFSFLLRKSAFLHNESCINDNIEHICCRGQGWNFRRGEYMTKMFLQSVI